MQVLDFQLAVVPVFGLGAHAIALGWLHFMGVTKRGGSECVEPRHRPPPALIVTLAAQFWTLLGLKRHVVGHLVGAGQAARELAQRMVTHCVGDGAESALGLIAAGILVDAGRLRSVACVAEGGQQHGGVGRIGARIADRYVGGLIDHLADVRVAGVRVVVGDLLQEVEYLDRAGDGNWGDITGESADAPVPGTCASDGQPGLVVQGTAAE